MTAFDSKYGIELWSPAGVLLADLSGLAKNRSFSMARNDAEQIKFDVDLNAFEAYCRSIGQVSSSLLVADVTEVRLRRGGTYMIGGQVSLVELTVNADQQTLTITVSGFLNLFKDRYTAVIRNFNNIDGSTIAATLLTETQTGGNLITNSDFEVDISGWGGSSCYISRSSSHFYTGSHSLQVSFTDAAQFAIYNFSSFDITQTYQFGAWVLIPLGLQVTINITYGTAPGGTPVTYTGTGVWQFIATNPQTAGATSGSLEIISVSSSNFVIFVDQAILMVTDAIVSPIIDGVNVLDFGVTIGNLATVGAHTRNYTREDIKDALVELSELQSGAFDFEFTYNKIFNTYASIGSNRPDIVLEYPKNINAIDLTIDATSLGNQIIGIGSGNGSIAQLVYPASDSTSQKNYKLRQRILNSSATDNSDNGLTDETATELAKWANPVRLLGLTIDGNIAPYVTDYHIGDTIQVLLNSYPYLSQFSGGYRLESIAGTIDDDDNESISLTVSA